MNRIAVAVLGNDQITREGAVSRLSAFQEVEVLPPDQHKRAEVILILAGQLSDGVLSTMERCSRDNASTRRPSIVLVANEFREDRVLRAIKFGLVSLLYRQDSGYDRIVQAILSANAGRAELPNSVLRYVLDQLKAIQNNVLAPRGLTVSGLSDREVDVLPAAGRGVRHGRGGTQAQLLRTYGEERHPRRGHPAQVAQPHPRGGLCPPVGGAVDNRLTLDRQRQGGICSVPNGLAAIGHRRTPKHGDHPRPPGHCRQRLRSGTVSRRDLPPRDEAGGKGCGCAGNRTAVGPPGSRTPTDKIAHCQWQKPA